MARLFCLGLLIFAVLGYAAELKHDTFDPLYRSAEGAAREGTPVVLRLRTGHFAADSVILRTYLLDTGSGATAGPVDQPMVFDQNITENGVEFDLWKATLQTPAAPSIVYYKFVVRHAGATSFYSDDYVDEYDNLNKGGTGVESATEPFDSFQITVYDPNFQTPAWLQQANVYQIFPDRFRNGHPTNDYCVSGTSAGCPSFYGQNPGATLAVTTWNSLLCDPRDSAGACFNNFGSVFYGGDLAGIETKLDYLQSIGFDTLYLTPIFVASSNHRYDTDDFLHADPALGGDAAFESLVAALKQRGMHLILDAVFNHASSDSQYFNRYGRFNTVGACQSLQSPYRSWFRFANADIPCDSYQGWYGYNSLPAIDHTQLAVQNFFYADAASVMSHWFGQGADGWRFDVAGDPNFPHQWWVNTRVASKKMNANGPLIGEIWPNASAWLAGDQFDSVMNYRFRRNVLGFARGVYNWVDDNDNGNDAILPLTPSQYDRASRAVRDDYPPQATAAMLNLIDSHDTNRALYVLTEVGDQGLTQARERMKLAAVLQFTSIGAPMVFYGDEAAINAPSRANGNNGPIGDPYARAPYPWSDQPGDASIYGPADKSMIAFYTSLAHVRKQHVALTSGTLQTLLLGDTQAPTTAPNTYAFARIAGTDAVLVALNNGARQNVASVPVGKLWASGTRLRNLLDGSTAKVLNGSVSLRLPARGAAILAR